MFPIIQDEMIDLLGLIIGYSQLNRWRSSTSTDRSFSFLFATWRPPTSCYISRCRHLDSAKGTVWPTNPEDASVAAVTWNVCTQLTVAYGLMMINAYSVCCVFCALHLFCKRPPCGHNCISAFVRRKCKVDLVPHECSVHRIAKQSG